MDIHYIINNVWFLILILTFQTELTYATFRYRISGWVQCDIVTTPFRVRWKLPMRSCVGACIIRAQCNGVVYNRKRLKCDFIETDYLASVTPGASPPNNGTCAYIKKTDMSVPETIENACQNCESGKVCEVKDSACIFKECPRLLFDRATVIGNRVTIGATVQIVPDVGYVLSEPKSDSMCIDGSWDYVPTTSLLDCGEPPTESNANISGGSTLYGSIREYECNYGYGVINSTVDMTVTCTGNFSWSPAMFECIEKTCQSGWFKREQSCYKFVRSTKLHSAALTYCASLEAHMITMETTEENNDMKARLVSVYGTASNWWLGIDDKDVEGTWVFTHNETPITFANWGTGEPSNTNYNEHCAVIGYGNTAWADVVCSTYRNVICEKAAEAYP